MRAPATSCFGLRPSTIRARWPRMSAKRCFPPCAEAGYNPIALDFRGHGKSEGSWRKARLRDYVDDARCAIADLGREPVLVGHSLGGLVIQRLLTERSFPAAVLIAPIPGRYPPEVIGRFALRHPLVTARANLSRNLEGLVGKE